MSVLGEITQVSPARLPSDSSSAENTSSREAAGGYEYGVSYTSELLVLIFVRRTGWKVGAILQSVCSRFIGARG